VTPLADEAEARVARLADDQVVTFTAGEFRAIVNELRAASDREVDEWMRQVGG
jgi:hypothetical protein